MELKCLKVEDMGTDISAFNRTKWNWNTLRNYEKINRKELLIVLNGIEIYEALQRWKEVAQLLIVLNGIEIQGNFVPLPEHRLLIVLNGIEIRPVLPMDRRLVGF